jgi:hypothetical protein
VDNSKNTRIWDDGMSTKMIRMIKHTVLYYDNRLDNQKGNRHNRNNIEIAEEIGRYRVRRRCVVTNQKENTMRRGNNKNKMGEARQKY